MIEGITLSSWKEFERALAKLRKQWEGNEKLDPELLYRGHSSSLWPLQTTLQRNTIQQTRFLDYFRKITLIKPEIETFTQRNWDIPDVREVRKLVEDYDPFSLEMTFGRVPGIEYMAHLRHHGFPSPLLDWTRSPYVAAFFAFNGQVGDYVSIYVLSEARAHEGSEGEPSVLRSGRYIKTHQRHFLQQSEYTLCLCYNDQDRWCFSDHDRALCNSDHEKEFPTNFAMRKYNIPQSERRNVLKALDERNLNDFSLFGSEDSLMSTIAKREFLLK
jgi:hypothetical protein